MLQPFCFEHEVAIAAIMKNEGHYVKEWLDYHTAAGVTKFYIYDNDSTDNLQEILQPYMNSGVVNFHRCPGKLAQLPAYMDAISRYRFECRYMAIIDGDEFIFPLQDKSIPETVTELFAQHAPMSALTLNWRLFGSSGHKEKNFQQGVLERFTHRGKDDFTDAKDDNIGGNFHIKSIVNPRFVNFFPNPHYAIYYDDILAKDEQGNVVLGPFNEHNPAEHIRVNHYFTKSLEEFKERRSLGCADNLGFRPDDEFYKKDLNDIYDDGILTYWQSQKERSKNIDRRQIILKATIDTLQSINTPNDDETGYTIENILCHWYACQTRYDKIFPPTVIDNFKEKLLQKIETIFNSTQNIWQIRLLVDSLPMLMFDSPQTRTRIVTFIRNALPRVIGFYRRQNKWSEYKQMQQLLETVKIL